MVDPDTLLSAAEKIGTPSWLQSLLSGGLAVGLFKVLDLFFTSRERAEAVKGTTSQRDITVGAAWQAFAERMSSDADRLRAKVEELEIIIDKLTDEKHECARQIRDLAAERDELNDKLRVLGDRVAQLERSAMDL